MTLTEYVDFYRKLTLQLRIAVWASRHGELRLPLAVVKGYSDWQSTKHNKGEFANRQYVFFSVAIARIKLDEAYHSLSSEDQMILSLLDHDDILERY